MSRPKCERILRVNRPTHGRKACEPITTTTLQPSDSCYTNLTRARNQDCARPLGWDTGLTWRYEVEPCSFRELRALDWPWAEAGPVTRMRTPNVRALTDRGAWQFARAFCVVSKPSRSCDAVRGRSLRDPSLCFFARSWRSPRTPPPRRRSRTYPLPETGTTRRTTCRAVQAADPVITNGVPTSIIRWGTTSGTPQSGYDYTTTIPPPVTLPGTGPLFPLGTFTHRNFEVGDPSLTSVLLDVVLVLDVDGVSTGPLTFTFRFNHEETPNNQNPCPVSDAARRRVYGPRDDRFLGATHDVPGRWHRLHVVDGFSGRERQSGVRIHHARRRHAQHVGPDRPVHVGADSAQSAAAA